MDEPEDEMGDLVTLARGFMEAFENAYLSPLADHVRRHPELLETVAGFLIVPSRVLLYVGKTHIVVEYEGPERIAEVPSGTGLVEVRALDCTGSETDLLEQVIGFRYSDGTSDFKLPLLSPFYEDLILPTNRGFDKMLELGWNLAAQDLILGLNGSGVTLEKGKFARIVNGFFFDASDHGLITRHIKWADCIPIKRDESDPRFDRIGLNLDPYARGFRIDANYRYPVPEEFRLKKLPLINRFIEHFSTPGRTEPEITSFLAHPDYQFILTMRFGCVRVIPQPVLEWQSESRNAIQPDFILVNTDGYGDICEFKLVNLKGRMVVGRENRETFSAEVNSYVSQTRAYREYFEDPNNRRWAEAKYGFKAVKPARLLVIGTRGDIENDAWKQIEADHVGLRMYSYNDLVDGVVAQFYV